MNVRGLLRERELSRFIAQLSIVIITVSKSIG